MKSYEYQFVDDGTVVEVEQPFGADALSEIDGRAVVRLVGRSSVVFKGTGWTNKPEDLETVRKAYEQNAAMTDRARRWARDKGLGNYGAGDSSPVVPDEHNAPVLSDEEE